MQIINTQYTEHKNLTPSMSVKQVSITTCHFRHCYKQKVHKIISGCLRAISNPYSKDCKNLRISKDHLTATNNSNLLIFWILCEIIMQKCQRSCHRARQSQVFLWGLGLPPQFIQRDESEELSLVFLHPLEPAAHVNSLLHHYMEEKVTEIMI